jgi:hypothetical protein
LVDTNEISQQPIFVGQTDINQDPTVGPALLAYKRADQITFPGPTLLLIRKGFAPQLIWFFDGKSREEKQPLYQSVAELTEVIGQIFELRSLSRDEDVMFKLLDESVLKIQTNPYEKSHTPLANREELAIFPNEQYHKWIDEHAKDVTCDFVILVSYTYALVPRFVKPLSVDMTHLQDMIPACMSAIYLVPELKEKCCVVNIEDVDLPMLTALTIYDVQQKCAFVGPEAVRWLASYIAFKANLVPVVSHRAAEFPIQVTSMLTERLMAWQTQGTEFARQMSLSAPHLVVPTFVEEKLPPMPVQSLGKRKRKYLSGAAKRRLRKERERLAELSTPSISAED